MTTQRRVLVHRDVVDLTGSVAARFITTVVGLLDEKPVVHVAFTGGGVGTGILRAINDSDARDSVDWSRVHVWWGDERWVPRGHADRNDLQAHHALLDHIPLRPENIHSFPAADEADDLDAAAITHARNLAAHATDGAAWPVFDVTFLGIGPDGHIASLFPDAPGIAVTNVPVIAVRNAPKPPPERLSLTLPVINSSNRIWIALAGADKASALGLALAGASTVEVPAAGAEGVEQTVFFVDRAAVADVPKDLISQDY